MTRREHTIADQPTPLRRLDAFSQVVVETSQAVVAERMRVLGYDESGAYEYYADLYSRSSLVHPYELDVARYLAKHLPATARIHELGTGFGSMGLLLAVAGFEVLAIDMDPRRLATAGVIQTELDRKIPGLAGHLKFIEGHLPEVLHEIDCAGVTAVATDVTSGVPLEDLLKVVAVVGSRYDSVVFDPERFFARTRNENEIEQVQNLFGRFFRRCEPVTDAAVGRFYFHAHDKLEHWEIEGADDRRESVLASESPVVATLNSSDQGRPPVTLDDAIGLANRIGIEVIKARIADLGEDGAGAGAYYAQIAGTGRLVQNYDRATARWLLNNITETTPVLEIGAGVGTLSLVLAASGRSVVALDLNQQRIETGRAIGAKMAQALAKDLSNLKFAVAKFPSDLIPVDCANSVAVITNMVFGWSDKEQQAMLNELARFQCAVLDADRFGVQRATQAERDAFDDMAVKAGLDVQPLDLLPNTRFVQVTGRKSSATAVLGASAMLRDALSAD